MVRLFEHVSHDVDDQARALQGWEQSYEQLGCGRFHGLTRQWLMDDGVLLRETTNRPLREEIAPPRDHFVLAVPMQADEGGMFAGRPLRPGSLLVLFPGQEYDVVSAGMLDLVGLSVHRDLLASLEPALQEWLETLRRGHSPCVPEAVLQPLRAQLLQADGNAAALSARGVSDPTVETELLGDTLAQVLGLAMAHDSERPAEAIPRRAHARLQVVRRAIDYMRANLQNDIGVPDICAAAFASRRTLQYCFEEFLHTTPQAYLRALRLNEARRALKSRGLPVTEVAGELGFSSASHFTHHYKVMFDELPSHTLRMGVYGSGGV
jgi:AraC family transcriptional regulator, ethanolamine operon transcriptional activator